MKKDLTNLFFYGIIKIQKRKGNDENDYYQL
nr:MAG TPA: hypothetical protein [Caudoviricetes sp.]